MQCDEENGSLLTDRTTVEEMCLEENRDNENDHYSGKLDFILTSIGYAVGMGNIWRFCGLTYEYGGGAFIISYLVCLFLFGLPLLYFEFAIGQTFQAGPVTVFQKIMPSMQGIGWTMTLISFIVGVYYNAALAWVTVYLYEIILGRSALWSRCDNQWNSPDCSSTLEDTRCQLESNGSYNYWSGGSCVAFQCKDCTYGDPTSPAEEYFSNFILERSDGIEHIGSVNLKLTIAFIAMWIIVVVCLVKGIKWISRVNYFAAPLPYFMVVILLIRAITLDGAYEGLQYYILSPDTTYLWKPETWRQALVHNCFSLSIGFGGLINMASHNRKKHNCYRDAVWVLLADSSMSLLGGAAAFAILGFMSKQLRRPLEDIVQTGTSLAFIAFPEAISRMPFSAFWAFLFFIMLFLLGISTQFGMVEAVVICIYDTWPRLRRRKNVITVLVCFFGCAFGLIMCTSAGIYWFNIFNDYTGNFSLMLIVFLEMVLVMYVYGTDNFMSELQQQFGKPASTWDKFFGPCGHLIKWSWKLSAPFLTLVIFCCAVVEFINKESSYGKGSRIYYYPEWANTLGCCIAISPLLFIPAFALISYANSEGTTAKFTTMKTEASCTMEKAQCSAEGENRAQGVFGT